ncbi:periplasmic binding protein [Nitzschia inconspicua]|uniref:Periplasmic binding protein n=1 Tax=Nitzschia inconspicua TaxID=303405 RepID=A0A9K3LZQ5_9STRA|nr:periplasmic binding protein [Nitzschia inconspicua]
MTLENDGPSTQQLQEELSGQKGNPPRIVSLLPSITEVLSSLGVADHIVGITHECDYPPEALEGATVVTISDISPYRMTQAEIHKQVTGSLVQGHSLYGLDAAKLKVFQPDIIFTQSLCDVCAVSYPVVTSTCAKIFGNGPHIVSLEPNNLKDVLETFLVAGRALKCEDVSKRVVDELQSQFDFIRITVNEHLCGRKRPLVAFLEWHRPFFTGGHWIADLMEIAGCDYRMCQSGDRSQAMSDEEFQAMDPDFILIGPCGFTVERAFEDTIQIMSPDRTDDNSKHGERSWWKTARAVKNGNVFALDGNSYFARPGPRLLQGCGLIARCVHGAEVAKKLGEELAPSSGMKQVTLNMYKE